MNAKRTLRVGLVGAGYIAGVHSAAWRAISGTFPELAVDVELAAVADADLSRADALARAWGWSRAIADWTEITGDAAMDIVDICVPNHLHAPIAIDAFASGKHVVCEKPLAMGSADARSMVEAAKASRLLAQVCFYYRLWPAIAYASEIVADGGIGTVQHFRGWMLQDYASDPTQPMGWRADRERAGAGALGDLGSHIVDIARALVGDIDNVCALSRSTVARTDALTDDLSACLLSFENGASGTLEASWAMRGHACDLGFDVVGSEGALRFGWERANELQVLTNRDPGSDGFRRILLGPGVGRAGSFVAVPGQGLGYRDAFTIGLGDLVEAIATHATAVSPSFVDGLRATEVIAAIQESATTRQWARVPGPEGQHDRTVG